MSIKDQLSHAAQVICGNAWGADRGTPRIYLNYRKDCKVFFEFPDTDGVNYLGGGALKIYIDDCGQHPNWSVGQKKKIMACYQKHALALAALQTDDEALAEILMNETDGADLDVDFIAHELANGRTDTVRAALAANAQ